VNGFPILGSKYLPGARSLSLSHNPKKKKKKHYSLSYVAVFKGNLNSENSYKVSDIPILGSKHLPSARFLPLYHNQKKNSDSLSFLYSLYKGSLCGK